MTPPAAGGAELTRTPDVLVVGAGVVGVATAYYLAARGRRVVVVDRHDSLEAACSNGSAGLISPSHSIPLARPGLPRRIPGFLRPGGGVYIRPRASADLVRFGLALLRSCGMERMLRGMRVLRDHTRASRDLFEELMHDGLEFGYRRDGVLNVCLTEHGFAELREDADLLEREGFRREILDADQARRLEPRLNAEIAGAVFWHGDAHCDPARFLRELAGAAEREGVRFEFGSSVTGFHRDAAGSVARVDTSSGSFTPRHVVLAGGAWTGKLARLLGDRIPLQPGKGFHVHDRSGGPMVALPMIFDEHFFAVTPMTDGLRIAGTMDFIGFDLEVPEARARRLVTDAGRYLDGLDGMPHSTTWSGLRPCSPDGLPIVGRSPSVRNAVYATGHGMAGLTLGPITGLAVAELLTGAPASVDLGPLSPARFAG